MTLKLVGVSAGYGGEAVVSDVSLSVGSGEVVTLLGPNGVGKSTLIKCMLGLLDPFSGRVTVGGEDLDSISRREIARRIGYVAQSDTTGYPSTVFETVLMGRKPYLSWRPSESDREQVAAVLDALGLADLAMRNVRELSGGQRQKVTIARALAQDPDVLVLDEPTSDLDIRHELDVLETIRRQAAAGRGAVLAMHDLTLAARYSDTLVLLHDGRVVAQGGPEVLTPELVEEVYGISVTIEDVGGPTIVPDGPSDRFDR